MPIDLSIQIDVSVVTATNIMIPTHISKLPSVGVWLSMSFCPDVSEKQWDESRKTLGCLLQNAPPLSREEGRRGGADNLWEKCIIVHPVRGGRSLLLLYCSEGRKYQNLNPTGIHLFGLYKDKCHP